MLLWIIVGLAALPCCLFVLNLRAYRRLPPAASNSQGVAEPVSILIPARNEEANMASTLASVLANRGVEFEVLVWDDGSSDRTAAIVAEFARRDGRVQLCSGREMPPGWCGKQHACYRLAQRARHPWLVFIDADVRLAPDALARMRAFAAGRAVDLASGVPRQEVDTFLERLLLPLIHFLLLGFLPISRMRRTRASAFGAGCGQLFLARAEAYWASGSHAAIRASLHDGLQLPRLFRRAGWRTDLFDATDVAVCRMYRNSREVWAGLTKNAAEGIAAPRAIVPWTVLLLGGQVLPLGLLGYSLAVEPAWLGLSLGATALVYLPRFLACLRFHQPWGTAWLHPLAVLVFVALQWWAWGRQLAGLPARWKGRTYAPAVRADSKRRGPDCGSRPGRRWGLARQLILAALLSCTTAGPSRLAAGVLESPAQTIGSFALTDQYERQHTVEFPRTKLMVVAVADRKGAPDIESWIRPVASRFNERVEIAGIADLSSVPALLRGVVRQRFLQDRTYPIMLDWEGKASRRFSCHAGKANLFVLDQEGKVLWRAAGKPSADHIRDLLQVVESSLRGKAASALPGGR